MLRRQSRQYNKKKSNFVLGTILATLLFVAVFWRWQNAAPREPDVVPQGDYTYTVAYADYRIRQLMKQYHLPSTAVALIDDQDTVWQEVFGLADVEKDIPATADTVYKLWSVAKIMTAVETIQLVEEGLVDLDAPITEYLPDVSIQSRFPDSGPITIRSVLSHHSGLPRNECFALSSQPGDEAVLREMVESLKYCHAVFPVGYRYKYTNIGPDILGYIIQEFRDESFTLYMNKLLARIGMENSTFLSTSIPEQKNVALGYEYYKGEYYPLEQGDITSLPSGNLYSTIEDMSDFARFVFRDGEANGEQIIEPETLHQMFKDQFTNRGNPQMMGLGWKITRALDSELLVWHDGGPGEGIGSLVALLPERKLGVVIFANEVSFDGSVSVPLAIEILELMLEAKYGINPSSEEMPKPINLDRSLLNQYAGKYIAFGQVMEVFLRGNRLKVRIQGFTLDLVPVGQTRFTVGHWLLKLGLTDLLQLPIDLRQLEIEFLAGNTYDEDLLIINMGDIAFEICPRYPEFTEIPAFWDELAGEYELVVRLPSGSAGDEIIGRDEVVIDDGVLLLPGVIGPLNPISKTEIIIMSGPFAGETMIYERSTGNITHQWVVYKPVTAE